MTAQKFRKKPVVVDVMPWDGTAAGATPVIDWILSGGGTATYKCDIEGNCPSPDRRQQLLAPHVAVGHPL